MNHNKVFRYHKTHKKGHKKERHKIKLPKDNDTEVKTTRKEDGMG